MLLRAVDDKLHASVQGNWLKAQGIKKGDAVAIYMPMTCECPIPSCAWLPASSLLLLCTASFLLELLVLSLPAAWCVYV